MNNNAKTPATGAQYARLGLTVTNGVLGAIDGQFSFEEMKELMKNETLIQSIITKTTSEVLNIPIDLWADQKKKIERFYKSTLNVVIDWSKVSLPEYDENYPRLEYVHADFNCKRYIDAYKKKFKDHSVASNSYSQDPDSAIHKQQSHPEGNYCFAWKGTIEPDTEHLNKSYDDFANDGNDYMIPKEGIIAAFRERFETGKMLDKKGWTCFHALDSGGHALDMVRNADDHFSVGNDNRRNRDSESGPRQINLCKI